MKNENILQGIIVIQDTMICSFSDILNNANVPYVLHYTDPFAAIDDLTDFKNNPDSTNNKIKNTIGSCDYGGLIILTEDELHIREDMHSRIASYLSDSENSNAYKKDPTIVSGVDVCNKILEVYPEAKCIIAGIKSKPANSNIPKHLLFFDYHKNKDENTSLDNLCSWSKNLVRYVRDVKEGKINIETKELESSSPFSKLFNMFK